MKKILLLVVIAFSCFAFTNADARGLQNLPETENPEGCWIYADAMESYWTNGGSNYYLWDAFYVQCMGAEYLAIEVTGTN